MNRISVIPTLLLLLLLTLIVSSDDSILAHGKHNNQANSCHDHINTSEPDKQCSDDNNFREDFYDSDGIWRFKYVDELDEKSNVLVREESVDQRLANIIYTTSSIRILDLSSTKYSSGDSQQDEANQEVVASKYVVDDELCGQHLSEMLQQMQDLEQQLERKRLASELMLNLTDKHYLLARVLDSFGRYASGHLLGRNEVPGSFEECTGSHLLLSSSSSSSNKVKTRFCWARLKIEKHLHHSLSNRKEHKNDPKDRVLRTGICIPETCHSKSFKKNRNLLQMLVNSQFKLPQSMYLEESLELESVYCLVDESSSYGIPLSGKLCICFILLWSGLTIYATFLVPPITDDKSAWGTFLRCLDLRKSWSDFVGSDQDNNNNNNNNKSQTQVKVQLDVLNPLKVFGTAYVVFGHSFLVEMATGMDPLNYYHWMEFDPLITFLFGATAIVDSFMVISGILLAYSTIQRESKPVELSKPLGWRTFLRKWSRIALARYLRLLPMFYLVFWFHKGVFIYLNNHLPYADGGFNAGTMIGACKQETWFSPLISLAAYLPIGRQCLDQTWSVAADLIYALTLTPILLFYPRKPKLAIGSCLLVCLFSIGWCYKSFHELEDILKEQVSDIRMHGYAMMFTHTGHLYTYPHNRLCPIALGLIIGYNLTKYKQAEELKQWPTWLRNHATGASILVLLVSGLTWTQVGHLKQLISPHHKTLFLQQITSFRFVWSLANGILFMRMVTDWSSPAIYGKSGRPPVWARICQHKIWNILVKLGYSILLVHFTFLIFDMTLKSGPSDYSMHQTITRSCWTYATCLIAGTWLFVMFENPMDKLAKKLILPMIYGS